MNYVDADGFQPQRETLLYPPPVQRSRCRTAVVAVFRAFVAILTLVMVALTIAGQVVPFCRWEDRKEEETYSVWRETKIKFKKNKTEQEAREENAGEKAFAVLAALFSAASCVLCLVFVGLWGRFESERRREVRSHAKTQQHAAEMRRIEAANPHGRRGDSAVSALGNVEEMYARERRRQRADRDVGIAAFSLLLATAVASLVTLGFMANFYEEEVADEVREKKGEIASMEAGFGLFVVTIVLAVVAFVVLAIPAATGLHLCCPPSVERVYAGPQETRSDSDDKERYRGGAGMAYAEHGYPGDDRYEVHHYRTTDVHHGPGGYTGVTTYEAQNRYGGNGAATPMPLRDEQLAAPRTAVGAQPLQLTRAPLEGMPSPPPQGSGGASAYSPPPPASSQQPQGNRGASAYASPPSASSTLPRGSGGASAYSSPPTSLPQLRGSGDASAYSSPPTSSPQPQGSRGASAYSPPPPASSPQPFVPTVVGTYPEALPGPASMEHVTLHHMAADGGVGDGAAFPVTQAAWRGEGGAAGFPPAAKARTAEDTSLLKQDKWADEPIKKL